VGLWAWLSVALQLEQPVLVAMSRPFSGGSRWIAVMLAFGWGTMCGGCPATNQPVDPPIIPGIDNDAQGCELTREQITLLCQYFIDRAGGRVGEPFPGGGITPFTCTDGSEGPIVAPLELCVSTTWAGCDDRTTCGSLVGYAASCFGATVEQCLNGPSPALQRELEVSCGAAITPRDCTLDRRRAYGSP
jgi:hypothetical protein